MRPLFRLSRGGMLLADMLVVSGALYLAFLLRFEGQIPAPRLRQMTAALPLLLAIRVPLQVLFGLHRWSFRLSGLHEAVRLVQASLLGSAIFVSAFYFIQRATEDLTFGPPRSVIVLEFLLSTSFIGFLRFSPRLARSWSLEKRRGDGRRVPALIVGAGSAGELLLRDLERSEAHPYQVLGFVDDDPEKWGAFIGGRRVLGPLGSLPALARSSGVEELLFAIPSLSPGRLREILGACAGLKLGYKSLPLSFAYLDDPSRRSFLQDLSPADLLPRRPLPFDENETRALVGGRRVLVTGAAGSIGSEICRQVAAHNPAGLVLVDTNESGLYLLYRELGQRHPRVVFDVEVADVRDAPRLQRLVGDHAPQDIFHAAAKKHVPLMELAPEEAVKTNVGGCRLVADAAVISGVERFVLVSTDKAVLPAGVMGATKRLAELIVRERAQRSAVRFTAVRFGNVLGSAGSVVPLFKSQIASGSPVTVTHPDCRRYMMTLGEAVGMVLHAGLRHDGDICVLEMGEPMSILELARLMITMAGWVPGREVPIVFTGLRPGEKLEEQLMTAEELALSREVRPGIRAVSMPPVEPGVLDQVGELERLAQQGDRRRLLDLLGELVPSYAASASRVRAGDTAHAAAVVRESA